MLRFRRSRLWIALTVAALAAACSFGVDLDHLVDGENGPDGGLPDAPVGAADAPTTIDAGSDGSVIASVDLEQIGSGANFTCVRKSTGAIACWGRGTEGRLGDNLATSRSTPADVTDLNDAIDLAVGVHHVCAIRKGGAVYCWGLNDLRQLGNGTTNEGRVPTPCVGVGNALRISAGASFTCAVLEDHTVSCWGDNSQGQLGAGDTAAHPTPVAVKDLKDVKQVATSVTAACALTTAGDVYCWGDNEDGQSASGDAGADLTVPRKVDALSKVTALSIGSSADHLCAVLESGEVKCWGYNDTGALGTGIPGDGLTPQNATTLNDIASVATGQGFSFAIHEDGTVSSWGTNGNRQLSIGDTGLPNATNVPLTAQSLIGITQIGAGVTHACALKGKREVVCWGSDVFGALGRKRTLTSNTPVKVTGDFKTVVNGRGHACATNGDKTVSCWGENGNRQLGRSDVSVWGQPATIASFGDVSKLSAGDYHSCALIGDGGIRCWGSGEQGAIGTGSSPPAQAVPVAYIAPEATDVATGSYLTCALLKNGTVSCAGASSDGRLGSPGSSTSTPRLVGDGGTPFGGVNALAVGRNHACVISNGNKSLSCWGNNDYNQLGRTGGSSSTPSEVALTKSPVQVALGYRHTCLRQSGNQTVCWGRNNFGQVTGTDATSPTPRLVAFPGNHYAIDLALGDEHSCAILDDKTVACWGQGLYGQLGTGQNADASQPVIVPGIAGATSIAAEESHTCAVTASGTFCWGTDFQGQLGVAPTMVTGTPAGVEGL